MRMRMMALAMSFTLLPTAAPADEVKSCTAAPDAGLSVHDTTRLAHLEDSRAKGLAANEKDADPEVGKALGQIYDRGIVAASAVVPGNYRCRTIKLGSQFEGGRSVAYGYFACRIAKGASGWTIAKTTGSQNFTGTLTPGGDGLLYKGAGHYGYEKPRAYGSEPEQDQVGCLYGIADNPRHYVLELPEPQFESLFNVIELVPAR